jgi:hypothetical protein
MVLRLEVITAAFGVHVTLQAAGRAPAPAPAEDGSLIAA